MGKGKKVNSNVGVGEKDREKEIDRKILCSEGKRGREKDILINRRDISKRKKDRC
jgi:hypothetical protein